MPVPKHAPALLGLLLTLGACGSSGAPPAPASTRSPQPTQEAAQVVAPAASSSPASDTAPTRTARAVDVIDTGLKETKGQALYAVSLAFTDGAVWVAGPGGLARVDAASDTATLEATDQGAWVSGGADDLWRAAFFTDRVTRYDPSTAKPTLRLDITGPGGVLATPGAVYVSQHTEGLVLALDPTTGRIMHSARVADPGSAGPGNLALAGGFLWVVIPRDKAIVKLDPDSLRVVDTIALDVHPGEGLWSAAGSLWAGTAEWEGEPAPPPGTLLRLDPATEAVSKSQVPAAHGPVAELEGEAWLAAGDRLVQLDRTTGQPERSVLIGVPGYRATLVAEASGGVWVGSATDPRVLRLSPRDLRPIVG